MSTPNDTHEALQTLAKAAFWRGFGVGWAVAFVGMGASIALQSWLS